MNSYLIGIDTGGTCTDAVCMDADSGSILATAKVPTTHHRLADGINRALSHLLRQAAIKTEQVGGIGLSTTLATNSVVEQKGAKVAVFIIGYVKHFSLPVTALVYLKGGHKMDGSEEEPLELESLVTSLEQLRPEVDAYAVCSALSTINPTHELVAEKAISLIDPKPVFCSHRASGQTGMKERAATAALHATLMPLMSTFIDSVGQVLRDQYLSAPLAIITGNGSPVRPDDAIQRSGATVASGPACTALFGAHHRPDTFLVVDVGGTTTDVVLVEDGVAAQAREGCTIGSWRTHLPSIDLHTGGIGGDSLVTLHRGGAISVGPQRVTPLCLAGSLPGEPEVWSAFVADNRLVRLRSAVPEASDPADTLTALLRERGACTPQQLATAAGMSALVVDQQLERLAQMHGVEWYGFTPTDALHLLGRADFGTAELAETAADRLGAASGRSRDAWCRHVVSLTEQAIQSLIVDYLARRYWGNAITPLLAKHPTHPFLSLSFRLSIPILGLGAASRFFLPAVARSLGTTVEFPRFFEVGNAVGAALSLLGRPEQPEGGPRATS